MTPTDTPDCNRDAPASFAAPSCSADKPKTIDFDLYANLRYQFDQVQSENLKLRQIAARVPAKIYIKAKEKAGYGEAVKPNNRI